MGLTNLPCGVGENGTCPAAGTGLESLSAPHSHQGNSFEKTGRIDRQKGETYFRKFDYFMRAWIVEYMQDNPFSYLYELVKAFEEHFHTTVSLTQAYQILSDAGYTNRAVERRAREIRIDSIDRFYQEINAIKPSHHQLVFLDETGLDNRDMLRTRGWFLKKQPSVAHDGYLRSKRNSFLAFLGCDGFLDVYQTSGTFTRLIFLYYCQELVRSGIVEPYVSSPTFVILH